MSYIATDALTTRMNEVLIDSAGTLRTVPLLRFQGDLPEGLAPDAVARRILLVPRIDPAITGLRRSASSPPSMGNLTIFQISVEVRVARIITRTSQLDNDLGSAVRAQAALDGDVVRQALEYPGNLRATAAAALTGLASGLLTYVGSTFRLGGMVAQGAQILETVHTFTGTIHSVPDVAQVAPTISIALVRVDAGTLIAAGMLLQSTVTGDPAAVLTLYRSAVLVGVITALYETVSADVGATLFVRATNGAGTADSNTIGP